MLRDMISLDKELEEGRDQRVGRYLPIFSSQARMTLLFC